MASPSELTQKLPGPALGSKKFLSTRRGTITLAVLAAAAAVGILLVFMSNYRDSVGSAAVDSRVLVADTFIDKGTSGDVIAEAGLFKPVTVTEEEAVEGAVTDPSSLTGQVLTEPIYRGQQLTAGAFEAGADPVVGRIEGVQRALTVPVGKAAGNVEQLEPGSRVDVLAVYGDEFAGLLGGSAETAVRLLARDILVLRVPESEGGSVASEDDARVVLRVTDGQATEIAYAAEHGDIWLPVRPPTMDRDSNLKATETGAYLGQNSTNSED